MKASQCTLPKAITMFLTIYDIILPSKHTYDLITVYLTLQALFKSLVTKSKIILAIPSAQPIQSRNVVVHLP